MKLAAVVGDTVRQVIKSSTTQVDVDIKRILRVTIQVRPKTQRRLRRLAQFVGDTYQRVTVRLLGSKLGRTKRRSS